MFTTHFQKINFCRNFCHMSEISTIFDGLNNGHFFYFYKCFKHDIWPLRNFWQKFLHPSWYLDQLQATSEAYQHLLILGGNWSNSILLLFCFFWGVHLGFSKMCPCLQKFLTTSKFRESKIYIKKYFLSHVRTFFSPLVLAERTFS